MLTLVGGEYAAGVDAERGGSLAFLRWRGIDVLRPSVAGSILKVASFPLVPFSNRIAHGRFRNADARVEITPNLPGADHPHPLHGFGWLAAWQVVDVQDDGATLVHRHQAGEWPWDYSARQHLRLDADGLNLTLGVTNEDSRPMPAGLGFHPYFPDPGRSVYAALHSGEWTTSDEGLPLSLQQEAAAVDWWNGATVGSRTLDTLYTHRQGPITIRNARAGTCVTLTPDAVLAHTHVYTPAGKDYFCVEPVSHKADALNQPVEGQNMRWLASGESLSATLRISVAPL